MRGKQATKRKLRPDPKFDNVVIGRLISLILQKGKKSIAQSIVYDSLDIIKEQTKKDPLTVFDLALRNVAPVLEVKSKRIGGANYQIPVEVRGERKSALALRWIIGAARSRKGKAMAEKLALELMDAAQKQGEAIKKKEDVHRMAEANRAFAHFA